MDPSNYKSHFFQKKKNYFQWFLHSGGFCEELSIASSLFLIYFSSSHNIKLVSPMQKKNIYRTEKLVFQI